MVSSMTIIQISGTILTVDQLLLLIMDWHKMKPAGGKSQKDRWILAILVLRVMMQESGIS